MKKSIVLLFWIVLIQPEKSFAWGEAGHRIIVEIAFKYISGNTRSNIIHYLNGTTIEQASIWMDQQRSNHQ